MFVAVQSQSEFAGMIFAIAMLCVLATGLWYLRKYSRIWYLSQSFSGPPALPLIGNANLFHNLQPEQLLGVLMELMAAYGKTVRMWVGCEFSLFMSDIKDVEFVLGTTQLLDKSKEYRYLRPWLHEGLLISKGRKWFKRRKVLTPAFHFRILEQFLHVFDVESRIMLQNLHHVAAKQTADQECEGFELGHWINLVTLDIICETAMGVSINAQTNADSDYVRAVKTISTVLHKRMFDILYRLDLTYKFTKLAREEKRALAILHGFTEKIIIQRREEVLKGSAGHENLGYDEVGAKKKLAFLDILLQSEIDGKPLSNTDIREEVDTFMFEGHDTTSSAITFFFYNVALHPGYQQKCFDEILSIFGKDKTKPATFEDLNKMHFMELCIKETLRMFPSVPLLGRKVNHECEINGKIIPAGTNIGICPLYMGRMEELFPKASEFIPERFDVVSTAEKMNPFAFIPFSAGPRNCIGQKFAMLEMKSIAANVLRHFVVEYVGNPAEEPQLVAELILRTKDPLKFMIRPRVY